MNDTANPKTFKIIAIVSIIVILVVASAFYFVVYYNSNHLNASQWNDEYNAWIETWSNGENPEFINYESGDSLIINGDISVIHLNTNSPELITHLFEITRITLDGCENPIPFHGDLTGNYTVGDTVSIRINIVDGFMCDSTGNELNGEIIEDYYYGLSEDKIS